MMERISRVTDRDSFIVPLINGYRESLMPASIISLLINDAECRNYIFIHLRLAVRGKQFSCNNYVNKIKY